MSHILKFVVIGDVVGKTSMLHSYTTNTFGEYTPVGILDNYPLTITIGGETYSFVLQDTTSCQYGHLIRPLTYPQTDVLLVCFSVVSPSSFENVKKKWDPEIFRHCPKIPFLLVGTQIDLRDNTETLEKLEKSKQKPITFDHGKMLAEEVKAVKYVECSALTQEGLQDVFDEALLAELKTSKHPKRQKTKRKCVIL